MDKEIANVQVIFAEDIREESSGQFSLIGAFQDNVETSSLPLQLPKFAMLVLISTRIDAPAIIKEFRFFARDKDGNEETLVSHALPHEMIKAQQESLGKTPDAQSWANLHMKIAAHTLALEKESQLLVEVTSISDIKYKSNSLTVKKRSPEATPSISFS